MGYFMTRVELHGGTSVDYSVLHLAMRMEGFKRIVSGRNNKVERLPPGQYQLKSSSLNARQVWSKANSAASKVGKEFAIVVTEGLSVWSGLEEVKPSSESGKKAARSL